MNNYRITFNAKPEELETSYWDTYDKAFQDETGKLYINFKDINVAMFPFVKQILDQAKVYGIKDIWFFYELNPTIEVTWLTNSRTASKRFHKFVKNLCYTNGFIDFKYLTPQDGNFGDWYHAHGNEEEREFGAKRHALCCKWVELYNQYRDPVDEGKGLDAQVKRTIHTLCNPLGLNYDREAIICLKRFIECMSFKSKIVSYLFWFYRTYINKTYQ